jgi:hypothetical protein
MAATGGKTLKAHRIPAAVLTLPFALLSLTCSAFGGTIGRPDALALLLEARTAAVSIKDPGERSSAREKMLLTQIGIDPSGAQELLEMFPNLPNKFNNLQSLAFNYAKAGNIKDTEEIYAEIMKGDNSERHVRLASANILGYVAWAYANAGKLKEAVRILSQLNEQFKGESLSILIDAPAWVAEAQAQHGDVTGAIERAKTIARESPYSLMSIIGGRVRANDMPGALQITSGFEESLQPYAKWGIVTAQREMGDLKGAQTTAGMIKPGHAKASALLELAKHHLNAGDRPIALLLLREAAPASRLTYNNWTRADIMWRIAATMANAGDAHGALQLAKSIEKDGHRTSAISDIVNAQAKQGNFKEAFDTALLLKNVSEANYYGANAYSEAIAEILAELTKSGRAKEALEAVLRFDDLKHQHQSLYCAIADAQADIGDIQGSRSTLSYAETEELQTNRRKEMARLTAVLKQREDFKESRQLSALKHIDFEIRAVHKAIALAYARQGSLAEASNIAADPDLSYGKDLFEEIGKASAEAGHETRAIAWARTLSPPTDKTYALLGIAQAISGPKNPPAAKQ